MISEVIIKGSAFTAGHMITAFVASYASGRDATVASATARAVGWGKLIMKLIVPLTPDALARVDKLDALITNLEDSLFELMAKRLDSFLALVPVTAFERR
jgi:hypothetical protein